MIGDQFEQIITKAMESLPKDRIAMVYVDKTLEDTRQGVNPSGDLFEGYAPSTKKRGKSDPVTFRDQDLSLEAIDFDISDDGAHIFFPEKGDIFGMHQDGTAKGGKKRRIVPEEEDYDSAPMMSSYDQVIEIVSEHINGQ